MGRAFYLIQSGRASVIVTDFEGKELHRTVVVVDEDRTPVGLFNISLVGGLEHFLLFHILGRKIPTDFHIFQRASEKYETRG